MWGRRGAGVCASKGWGACTAGVHLLLQTCGWLLLGLCLPFRACGQMHVPTNPTPSHPCSRCHPCPPPAGRPYLVTSLLGLSPLPPTPVPVSEAAARDAEARLRLGATPSEAALDAQDLVGEGGRGGTGGGEEGAGAEHEEEEEEGEEEREGLGAGPGPIASMTSEGEPGRLAVGYFLLFCFVRCACGGGEGVA